MSFNICFASFGDVNATPQYSLFFLQFSKYESIVWKDDPYKYFHKFPCFENFYNKNYSEFIDKYNEILNFLTGYEDTDTLQSILSDLKNKNLDLHRGFIS